MTAPRLEVLDDPIDDDPLMLHRAGLWSLVGPFVFAGFAVVAILAGGLVLLRGSPQNEYPLPATGAVVSMEAYFHPESFGGSRTEAEKEKQDYEVRRAVPAAQWGDMLDAFQPFGTDPAPSRWIIDGFFLIEQQAGPYRKIYFSTSEGDGTFCFKICGPDLPDGAYYRGGDVQRLRAQLELVAQSISSVSDSK